MKNKILLAFCVLCLCFCTACGGNAYVKPVQPEIDGVTDNREEEVKPSGDSEIKDSVAGGNNTDNDGDNTDNDKEEVKDDGAADGETVSEYTVSTYEDFLAMADDPSANYTLVSDLDLSGVVHTAVFTVQNPFTGKFYGGGHAISNLYMNKPESNVSLFGVVQGEIYNLNLTDFNIELSEFNNSGEVYIGALAGTASGKIYNVAATGNIFINGVSSNCNVLLGGLIGKAMGCIADTELNVNISVNDADLKKVTAGGLAGFSAASVMDCVTHGSIRLAGRISSACAGGLIGFCSNTAGEDIIKFIIIDGCQSDVSITSATSSPSDMNLCCGGLIACMDIDDCAVCMVMHCEYTGNISVYKSSLGAKGLGGFIGYANVHNSNVTFKNCGVKSSEICGRSYVGGFAGRFKNYAYNGESSVNVIKCFTEAKVLGGIAGGFVCIADGTVFYKCYTLNDMEMDFGGGFCGIGSNNLFTECFSSGNIIAHKKASKFTFALNNAYQNCRFDCNLEGENLEYIDRVDKTLQ